jgi:hypothetical protein
MAGLSLTYGHWDAGLQLSAPAGTAPTAWAAQQSVSPRPVFPLGQIGIGTPCRPRIVRSPGGCATNTCSGDNKAAHGTLLTKIQTMQYLPIAEEPALPRGSSQSTYMCDLRGSMLLLSRAHFSCGAQRALVRDLCGKVCTPSNSLSHLHPRRLTYLMFRLPFPPRGTYCTLALLTSGSQTCSLPGPRRLMRSEASSAPYGYRAGTHPGHEHVHPSPGRRSGPPSGSAWQLPTGICPTSPPHFSGLPR